MTRTTTIAAADASTWALMDFVDYRYVDEDQSGARRSQGIVWNADAGEWITSWQFGLARESEDFQFLQTTGSVDFSTMDITTGIPTVLAEMGFDHIGDIDYYDGKLYISLDSEAGDYQNGHVAVLNADDLSYSGELYELVGDPTNEHDDVASWVAVDGENGVGYGKEWQNGNTINIYDLKDWSFEGTLEMDQNLKNIQGAKVFDGKLYCAAHDSTKSVYSVDLESGHVEKLFDLPKKNGGYNETEGIEIRQREDGTIEIFVEMIVDPDDDNYADTYVRMFHYVLGGDAGDVSLAHTWVVNDAGDTSNAEDMALTLREALAKAEAGDTITFDASLAGSTITLEEAELAIEKDLTILGDIDGDGKADITIDSAELETAIRVSGGKATLDGLIVLHDDDSVQSSIAVEDGASLDFVNGATMAPGSKADDAMNGTGHWDAIRGGRGSDTLKGLGGDDLLYGERDDDVLKGGAGDDSLDGGAGRDRLWGGANADHFVFASGDSDARAKFADVILDFSGKDGDLIDLSEIDANGNRRGDQEFDFIGRHQFSGHAGELRYVKTDNGVFVSADTDGDGKADFGLRLDGVDRLVEDHFAL